MGSVTLPKNSPLRTSSATWPAVQPLAKASAASSPSSHFPPLMSVGFPPLLLGLSLNTSSETRCIDAAPSSINLSSMASMQALPLASLSGHSTTVRPLSGVRSALCQELEPFGQHVATYSCISSAAASAAFSPSHSTTGTSVRCASSSRRSNGRGSGKPCQRHCVVCPSERLHQVSGAKTFLGLPSSSGPRSKRYSAMTGWP
ncbi:hypothetical protein [Pseudomonas sp. 24 E 13]|nr:hypothetical protein [Pseudomonas sp. 24 E 13]CRM40161.1 hypothetical protein [Pseudomonas sp. 24 E 13]